MMAVTALAMGFAGFALIAEEESKPNDEQKEKAVSEMNVEELKALHAKKVAGLAAETDEAKKKAIQAEIDAVKKALEEKGVKEEKSE